MSETHVLYRFYSTSGQLLYVGITMNPAIDCVITNEGRRRKIIGLDTEKMERDSNA